MNGMQALFQLHELAAHIQDVIENIQAGNYDKSGNLSYKVDIGHLMDHLVMAWHYAHMTDENIDQLSQNDYELIISSIPKLRYGYRLVDLYEDII